jgi:SAM-dependent methyltransferase
LCEVLFQVSKFDAASHFVVLGADPTRHAALARHIGHLWGTDTGSVVKCAGCQACHATPFVAGDQEFYRLAYPSHGYPRHRWEYSRTATEIRRRVGDGRPVRRLLEVGAGKGIFLDSVCPSSVRQEDILCTEYSDSGATALAAKGYRCIRRDVREISESELGGKLDVVCMFQVVEHLDRPDQLFRFLASITVPGGSLFVSTPSDRMIDFYERNGCLLDMPPNHLTRWNAAAFRAIANRTGWRIDTHEYSPPDPLLLFGKTTLYRYMRRSQESGTIASRVASIRWSPARRVALLPTLAFHAVSCLRLLPELRRMNAGDTQWASLVRD